MENNVQVNRVRTTRKFHDFFNEDTTLTSQRHTEGCGREEILNIACASYKQQRAPAGRDPLLLAATVLRGFRDSQSEPDLHAVHLIADPYRWTCDRA